MQSPYLNESFLVFINSLANENYEVSEFAVAEFTPELSQAAVELKNKMKALTKKVESMGVQNSQLSNLRKVEEQKEALEFKLANLQNKFQSLQMMVYVKLEGIVERGMAASFDDESQLLSPEGLRLFGEVSSKFNEREQKISVLSGELDITKDQNNVLAVQKQELIDKKMLQTKHFSEVTSEIGRILEVDDSECPSLGEKLDHIKNHLKVDSPLKKLSQSKASLDSSTMKLEKQVQKSQEWQKQLEFKQEEIDKLIISVKEEKSMRLQGQKQSKDEANELQRRLQQIIQESERMKVLLNSNQMLRIQSQRKSYQLRCQNILLFEELERCKNQKQVNEQLAQRVTETQKQLERYKREPQLMVLREQRTAIRTMTQEVKKLKAKLVSSEERVAELSKWKAICHDKMKTIQKLERQLTKQSRLMDEISQLEAKTREQAKSIREISNQLEEIRKVERRKQRDINGQTQLSSKRAQELRKVLEWIRASGHSYQNLEALQMVIGGADKQHILGNKGNFIFMTGEIFREYHSKERQFLAQTLERILLDFIGASLLYKYDSNNPTNPHKLIDGCSNIVIIARTSEDKLIAAYSQAPLKPLGAIKGRSMIMSLWGQRYWESLPNSQSISYDKDRLVFGNGEVIINLRNPTVECKLGSIASVFKLSEQDRWDKFHGCLQSVVGLEHYDIYQLELNSATDI